MILGFVAKDISTILEYKDCDQEIREHVDNGYINIYYKKSRPNEMGELKNKSSLFPIIQCQTNLINESRLYCVILRSKNENSKLFQKPASLLDELFVIYTNKNCSSSSIHFI
jgi:prophage antirepressor-like protein